jgi:hypothetical protein
MLDPRFKDPFILNNHVGIQKTTIATRYDFETIIPFFYSIYQKMHLFVEHPSNFGLQEWPFGNILLKMKLL